MTKNGVTEMLTALDVQGMLQIDRSTVYRMADAGQLPAIKVGKQWRFPADQIHQWFQAQATPTAVPANSQAFLPGQPRELNELLSWEWLRTVQETFASLLGGWLNIAKTGANKATLSVSSLS